MTENELQEIADMYGLYTEQDVQNRVSKTTDELKHFLALWENAVCEIRKENKACDNNTWIASLCNKLESSMVAYAKGDAEYALFVI